MRYLFALLLSLCILLTGAVASTATVPSFETRLHQLLDRTRDVVDYLISHDYLIERIDVDLVMAGRNYISFHQFYDFYNHQIIGIGEAGVIKLDGYILDSEGNSLVYDDEDDAVPVLLFAPTTTGEHRLQFHWAETADGYPEDHLGYVAIVYALQHRE